MTTKALRLKGCNEHNLKNLSLSIPKECVVVVTGVSGSGKSSLAFDTLYAEGQRRYLEYLSPDVRAHIKLMKRPDVESIDGLSPTLATGHATLTQGRTTISSHTDIYDFLTLLFVKAGVQHSPATGRPLERLTRPEIVERILSEYGEGERIQLIAPVKMEGETPREAQQRLLAQGFVRILSGGEEVEEVSDEKDLEVVVDRLEMQGGIRERLAQSIETALDLSKGILKVQRGKSGEITYYTEIYVCPESGLSFPPLTAADFNPRSKRGACPACGGVGTVSRVDFSKFPWSKDLPLFDQITPFFKELPPATRRAAEDVLTALEGHPAYKKDSLKVLIEGLDEPLKVGKTHVQLNWKGLNKLFEDAKAEIPFSETSPCTLCHGERLKPETLFCRIDGQSIASLEKMVVARLLTVLPKLAIAPSKKALAEEILPEILTRLQFLEEVGLGYLEMNRRFDTLSDGEAQRVELASLLGARLSGLLYVLDEPSRGLHPLDTKRLQAVVRALAEGSSVLMVEHDPQLILGADHIIEMGPGAGPLGGNVIFEGTPENLLSASDSPTGLWLKEKATPPFKKSAPAKRHLSIVSAHRHNLHGFNAEIPLERFTVLTGVSGSGKSTLAFDVIGSELQSFFTNKLIPKHLKGFESFERVNLVPQRKSPSSARSTPATYTGIMDPLRQLFAETKLAKARGYGVSRFSLNTRGGRCEACQGLGVVKVSMQLIADMTLPCEVCGGKRYNYETLQVSWDGHTMADVLEMSVAEAHEAFKNIPPLASKLKLLNDLGLDYLALGQRMDTLSGGELQRLRLISDLAAPSPLKTLYIIDEPSAGLHFQDVKKLLAILDALVEEGHTVLVIEHNPDIIARADWALELGPEGGPGGGRLLFSGPPSALAASDTPTGRALTNHAK